MRTPELLKDARAERALMREYRGQPGLAYRANPKRQCVHVAIHDGALHGTSITFDAVQFAELLRKLLGVEIRSIEYLRAAVTAAPDMVEALQALQVVLTPKATHCHRIIADALANAKGVSK